MGKAPHMEQTCPGEAALCPQPPADAGSPRLLRVGFSCAGSSEVTRRPKAEELCSPQPQPNKRASYRFPMHTMS